jgi:hypothetical protein
VVLGLIFAGPGPPSPSSSSLWSEDFESPDAANRWRYANGPEFPGASGSFRIVEAPVHGGKRAGRLEYDFSKGGVYVEAWTVFPAPIPGREVSFWASLSTPGTEVRIRLTDETGQTFQSRFPAPFVAAWTEFHVRVGDFEEFWGGANDGVFHGPLARISVLACRGLDRFPKGALVLDDIRASPSAEAVTDPFGVDARPPFHTGLVSDLVGVESNFVTHFPLDTRQIELAKAAGFGFVRSPLNWDWVEKTKGRYDFKAWNDLVRALSSSGLGSYLILCTSNPLYYDGPGAYDYMWGPRTEATRRGFAAFAREAARNFAGRNVVLEVWNEPNIQNFWHPKPYVRHYNLLAAAVLDAVKGAGLKVPIIVGSTSTVDLPYLETLFKLGGLARVDAVSLHPYRATPPETFYPEFATAMAAVRADAGRTDLPFYSGEWGYSSTWFGGRTAAALNTQALHAIRLILTNLYRQVPKTVWYDLKDDGEDPKDGEHNFGLVKNKTLAPKPAYKAVKAFHDLQPPGKYSIGSFETHQRFVYGVLIKNGRGKLAAVWTDQPSRPVILLVPERPGLKAYSMFGRPLTLGKSGAHRSVRLAEEKGPVYLKIGD